MKDVSYEAWRISFQSSKQAARAAYVSWMEAVSKEDKGVITIDRLREMGACEETLEFLSNRFGDSITITEENAVSCAEDIDWGWASENLLNEAQRRLYEEAHDKHWKEYTEACDKNEKAYEEACAGLSSADKEAYDKHLKAYIEACDPYFKAYNEACAKAFVAAYYTK